jgi:hypothetical protein
LTRKSLHVKKFGNYELALLLFDLIRVRVLKTLWMKECRRF